MTLGDVSVVLGPLADPTRQQVPREEFVVDDANRNAGLSVRQLGTVA